jgi:hypothetical protein
MPDVEPIEDVPAPLTVPVDNHRAFVNAGVRVFRARQTLKRRVTESCGTFAEHGCRDCSCQQGR